MGIKGIKKVIVVGSGGIKIAEAAEFDYSGSQALQALRDLGIKSIIFNPNVATVQTSYLMADSVYILPLSEEYLRRVILKEKPDGILAGFGGQTALNACLDLWKSGFLEANNVKFLGTKPEGIMDALGRADFHKLMKKCNIAVPPSMSAKSLDEGLRAVKKIGLPVICRVSFNLGGRGSFIAHTIEEFKDSIGRALAQSRTGEVLIEKYLSGWKELEYEVMRDIDGNSSIIACLENIDPMGTHTGESVVVAPAQTLDNYIYQEMRSVAIKVAESIDLVGECNVQFALDPKSNDFYVIETNPRMSRSSALASKVTGYPIAYVAAKLAVGIRMHELKNEISSSTSAYFEPSLDYIAIKMPRWDTKKFERAEESIGSEMKSIGEVMGIGRNFEEAMQKAVRMLDIGEEGIISSSKHITAMSKEDALNELRARKPYWFLYAAQAFRKGATLLEVEEATGINGFFLDKIKGIVDSYESFVKIDKTRKTSMLKQMLRLGFSEKQLGFWEESQKAKHIDTLAGEWPSDANYMYLTHEGNETEIKKEKEGSKGALILGAGCFRIGVSVEFDYATTMVGIAVKNLGRNVITLNCNPETVSTDWNRSDMLFFDQLSKSSVLSITAATGIKDVVLFTAGQIGNNIASELEESGINILGSSNSAIESAEDRESFSKIVNDLGIEEPEWAKIENIDDAVAFAYDIGFPVLVRPSFVLSGSSMGIAYNESELRKRIESIETRYTHKPVIISKYIENAEEADLDCAADGKSAIGVDIFHIEEAGVHSGDSTMQIFPSNSKQSIARKKATDRMHEIAMLLVKRLSIRGPFNLQFAIKEKIPYVIELNLRASRSMPFSSKAAGIELMDYGIKGSVSRFKWNGFYSPRIRCYGVKSPQFSWAQLKGAYPVLGAEMHGTGEVASFDNNYNAALLKSWISAQPNRVPSRWALLYGNGKHTDTIVDNLKHLGIKLYTLEEGSNESIVRINEDEAIEAIKNKRIDIIFTNGGKPDKYHSVRRTGADYNVPLVLNSRLGSALSAAFGSKTEALELKDYW